MQSDTRCKFRHDKNVSYIENFVVGLFDDSFKETLYKMKIENAHDKVFEVTTKLCSFYDYEQGRSNNHCAIWRIFGGKIYYSRQKVKPGNAASPVPAGDNLS